MEFVNINSTTYLASGDCNNGVTVITQFEELYVCNPGLLKGQAKVQEDTRSRKEGENSLSSVCDQLSECVRVADVEEKRRSYEIFLHRNSEKLRATSRPWYLPRHLGGLDLPWGKTSRCQMLAACSLVKSPKDVSDLKETSDFQTASRTYLSQILRYNNIKRIDPVIALEQPENWVEPFESPTLAHLFLGSKYTKVHSPERKYKKLIQKMKSISKKSIPSHSESDLKNMKFFKGGLESELVVSVC